MKGTAAMSARRRTLVATAVALAATATAVLSAGTANASAPAPATSNVSVTLGTPAPVGALLPGGAAETFTVTATNNTATAREFTAEVGGSSTGALPLPADGVVFGATAIGGTPATGGSLNTQDGDLLGAFYPAGGSFGDSFTLPAHATYSWKLSLAATKAWPLNDGDLTFFVDANQGSTSGTLDFKVGDGDTGGPVAQTFNGDSTVAPGQPAYEYLDVTNNTGATLGKGWADHLVVTQLDPNGPRTFVNQVTLETDVWNGRAYVPVPAGESLPPLSKDLAPGATAVYRIRVDLVTYAATTERGRLRLDAFDMSGMGSADSASKVLLISRDPLTGPQASASASASSVASPSASPSASASASAAAPHASATPTAAPSTPIVTTVDTGADLAETGGGSGTGTLAAVALALLAAGSSVVVALKLRARRR
ncbi:hypothetical protein [Streptacidiphilus sp. P02-A3a]|uniref:hypothetical protein n=1 Tax=Streptacidiphilus sp. P02-A3a TaxID=2704468 RepID=UPI0015F8FB61|nr:hypothetical protein [Streptacidiphilus sp. P02-A3a]QMU73442.1 hypothetical protein GXP74_39670 [Streptacidiphilus sp. P02-A3a]